jgi:hypothetical protein
VGYAATDCGVVPSPGGGCGVVGVAKADALVMRPPTGLDVVANGALESLVPVDAHSGGHDESPVGGKVLPGTRWVVVAFGYAAVVAAVVALPPALLGGVDFKAPVAGGLVVSTGLRIVAVKGLSAALAILWQIVAAFLGGVDSRVPVAEGLVVSTGLRIVAVKDPVASAFRL